MFEHSQQGKRIGVRQSWLWNTLFPWNISFKSQLGWLLHPSVFRVTNSLVYSVRILKVPWDIIHKIWPCVWCPEKISDILVHHHEIACLLMLAGTIKSHSFWAFSKDVMVFYEASITYLAKYLLAYVMICCCCYWGCTCQEGIIVLSTISYECRENTRHIPLPMLSVWQHK